ncbi:hypothetical protein GH714_015399 [Hevea brasiliensis]|uniref:Beta-glucosidase n=1 Tax=Hevea brasiliensis TaxID=3981 RepID=A0A6A6N222_HEVBR|nr:hypothetical protein GH714_015399 [Hevea brasiliensis]
MLISLACLMALTEPARDDCDCDIPKDFGSSYFPPNFTFGTATSAYQIEGGTGSETGRGPSVWDTFTHETPGTYLRVYKDIANVKKMGFKAFRMSISWSRVIPKLEPFVTIFHWDTRQALEDKYGGFLSRTIV